MQGADDLHVAGGLDLAVIFFLAGIASIASGFLFRQPIPVQPMKVVAAGVITGELTQGSIVVAGIFIGVFMLLLALTGAIEWINRAIPKAVIQGIQAGVGLNLAIKGFTWGVGLPLAGVNSPFVAAGVFLLLFGLKDIKAPILLIVFFAGFAIIFLTQPELLSEVGLSLPTLGILIPESEDWKTGLVSGALPQLPLTTLNSVVALCALSACYFPGREISPKKIALALTGINLALVPFGSIPLCYGASGLAAQYRFGARTGGSPLILGALKIAAALLFGAALAPLVKAYPLAILAPMLILSGFQLASSAKNEREIGALIVIAVTAGLTIFVNTGVGFLAGLAIALLAKKFLSDNRFISTEIDISPITSFFDKLIPSNRSQKNDLHR
ncbi:MAG: putative sulfate/molybdate transporter [Myxococcota bacterium]